MAGREAQRVRVGERLAVEIGEQHRGRLVVARCARSNRHSRCRSRCCSGMRHCQPALRAVERVSGLQSPPSAHGTATARSLGSQCVQSSNPDFSVCSISRRAEARAVDEQLAGRRARRSRARSAVTKPSLRILLDLDDLAFGAHDALRSRRGRAGYARRGWRRTGRRSRAWTAASSAGRAGGWANLPLRRRPRRANNRRADAGRRARWPFSQWWWNSIPIMSRP